ncbi:hypothetical protein SEA_SOSHI_60 [Streptomyces phage Soshi]|uniref:Uncharacterized protein n=1 Tax=Streptomyces phage Soshi TaxID=2601694 RepID=A0A5J6DAJ6_9CAUD|nr:hypothetical protein SEA_SOSHI_60 [Streptomyces phage Soshi]
MSGREQPTGSAEEFDPYSFAERWYHDTWPIFDPIGFSRYVSTLRTLGQLDVEEG